MLEANFPALKDNFLITSPIDARYNCIAWAYGENSVWFWPDRWCYWPVNIPREETVEAFVSLFSSINYRLCDDSSLEVGYEKIAIYMQGDAPTHAAKQLSSGKWSSKLGESIDIQHDTPEDLNGPLYGEATVYMKRKV